MSNSILVVPCHDEAQRLDVSAFSRFVGNSKNIRFLLVNDGSRDRTLSVLQGMAAAEPRHFQVLNLAQNLGKAEAVRRGVLDAAQHRPDYIGYWDADLATPLESIPHFVSALDRLPEISLVMGVRISLLGHKIRRRRLRRWLGRFFARITALALKVPTRDTQCGAKLFRATPEMLAAFSQPFGTRWIFDVELLARLIRMRRGTIQPLILESLYELPLDQWEDVAGSKLKRSDFVKAARELAAIWRRYLRPGAPPFAGVPLGESAAAPALSEPKSRAA